MLLVLLLACVAGPSKSPPPLTRAERLDPDSCAGCHPDHHKEWSGSMHAHAGDDPVFIAMNAYGQRQTDGALGDFCVRCHAPVALAEGLTTDGTNLGDLDPGVRGVGCYACHQIDQVTGTHNNATRLADDGVFRGALDRPMETTAHGHEHSPLHDRDKAQSATLCGACHDVVTPAGVHLERTFLEWQLSQYSVEDPGLQQTCGSCHMPGRDGTAATVDGAPDRRVHSHSMPGVDLALVPWPERDAQRALVQDALDPTVLLSLEVFDYGVGTGVLVSLDNVAAGHGFPSGAAHDRRAWVELVAKDASGSVVWSSGTVGADQSLRDAIVADPLLWWLGDHARDGDGNSAHMFWEVATVERAGLPAPSRYPVGDSRYLEAHQSRTFDLGPVFPATVEAAIHIRPIGREVLDVLVDSGDLDPAVRAAMPTLTLGGSVVRWAAPADSGTPEAER